jgi:Recombination endonuclease VII
VESNGTTSQTPSTGLSGDLCGKWMPRARTACARRPNHKGDCRTAEALADSRVRLTERRRGKRRDSAIARRRWALKYRLSQYGLTQEGFDQLLEAQGHACGMCFTLFEDGQPIFVDHDHDCCKAEKRSCGECRRGLLCLSCNTALGIIERKGELARAYLHKYEDPRRLTHGGLAT